MNTHLYHVQFFTIDDEARWVDRDGELTANIRKAGRFSADKALDVARAYMDSDNPMHGVSIATAEPRRKPRRKK